jgi:hypothetical protein
MKKVLTTILALTLLVGLTVSSAVPVGAQGCDPFTISLPSPVTITLSKYFDDSYFHIAVTNGDWLNGTYPGFCIDTELGIDTTTYSANVYSSYNPADPPTGLVDNPENLDLVNYLINQEPYGETATCGGTYVGDDIQIAIWKLLDDEPDPYSLGGLNGNWATCRVDELVADAIANGEGYVPGCGDLLVIILEPYNGEELQPAIIWIPLEEEEEPGGCTPGFWKNNAKNWEHSAWENYVPGDFFNAVFGTTIEVRGKGKTVISNPTLLQALEANGGGINALARHAVAALLNINNPDIAYPMTEGDLFAAVQAAIIAGEPDITDLKDQLDEDNNAGCTINQRGEAIVLD